MALSKILFSSFVFKLHYRVLGTLQAVLLQALAINIQSSLAIWLFCISETGYTEFEELTSGLGSQHLWNKIQMI